MACFHFIILSTLIYLLELLRDIYEYVELNGLCMCITNIVLIYLSGIIFVSVFVIVRTA